MTLPNRAYLTLKTDTYNPSVVPVDPRTATSVVKHVAIAKGQRAPMGSASQWGSGHVKQF